MWRIVSSEGRLTRPSRITDKFSLVFSKFSQIALVSARLGEFCENFETKRENLSLILLGLIRLHIQMKSISRIGNFGPQKVSLCKLSLLVDNGRYGA